MEFFAPGTSGKELPDAVRALLSTVQHRWVLRGKAPDPSGPQVSGRPTALAQARSLHKERSDHVTMSFLGNLHDNHLIILRIMRLS